MSFMPSVALFTDLYELTMAASYFQHEMFAPATFSLFVRELPPHRGFLVAAGLAEVLQHLENFSFTEEDLTFLRETGRFTPAFLNYLAALRFTGEVHALPEGQLCFGAEPLLEVTAPLIEAQLVETLVLNTLHVQTLIASKAARCLAAAQGRSLIDFSLRRTHGVDAGLKVARASYLAGFLGTSNVLAGKLYGIPYYGTMAHSFIESFDDEETAFAAYAKTFPDDTALLIDTYDTLTGARHAARIGQRLKQDNHRLRGVRLDSGDLLSLSRETRAILDAAGLQDVQIYASGGLNEKKIDRLMAAKAPIDVFGVGTDMGVSADAPSLDMAYKLVEYAGKPRLKLSAKKVSLLGQKQILRVCDDAGHYQRDIIALRTELPRDVAPEIQPRRIAPLLLPVMRNGRCVRSQPSVQESRAFFLSEFAKLPETYKLVDEPARYPVTLSAALDQFQAKAVAQLQARYSAKAED